MNKKIVEYLFKTEAFKVAPEGEVFLFTSGLISPYYINTHFLCGGEKASVEMLSLIDTFKASPKSIISAVCPKILELCSQNNIYAEVIEMMCDEFRSSSLASSVSFISGGERRDWFFSIPMAKILNLPILYLYNHGLVLDESGELATSFENSKCLHVADLLTVGSSYTSKWIPCLQNLNLDMAISINCVNRNQGGDDNLINAGVTEVRSLCKIDEDFFVFAKESGAVSAQQYDQLIAFYKDPYSTMREYLIHNPDFVRKSLVADEKTRARIRLTLDNDLYKLDQEYIENIY